MQRVIVNMQSFLMSEAIEQALKSDGDFYVTVVEKPEELPQKCRILAPTILLMEVTRYRHWNLAQRLAIRDEIKRRDPNCKVVFLVDENAEKEIAGQVKLAKKDGLIDQFVYGSTSASYLSALLETL